MSQLKQPTWGLEVMPDCFVCPILPFGRGTPALGAKSGQGCAKGATEPLTVQGGMEDAA